MALLHKNLPIYSNKNLRERIRNFFFTTFSRYEEEVIEPGYIDLFDNIYGRIRHFFRGIFTMSLIKTKASSNFKDNRRWLHENGDYIYQKPGLFYKLVNKSKTLNPGYYRALSQNGMPVLCKLGWETDEIVQLEDDNIKQLKADFENFWSLKDAYKELKFLHKRGVLLWGSPGGGKSTIVSLLSKYVIEQKGFVLTPNSSYAAIECIKGIRNENENAPILVILEDLDALINDDYGEESSYLNILDGQNQVPGVFYLATTNYPEKLDERIKNRPSRFDLVLKISAPNAAVREQFIKSKLPNLGQETLDAWVRKTEDYSIAHIKEFIIQVWIYKKDPNEVLARFSEMGQKISSTDFDSGKLGFATH